MNNFDVVMIGDFRFPGGTSVATAHEIRALAGAGLSIGLLQTNADILRLRRPIHALIQACIDRNEAAIIPAGGREVGARLGILHNPMVFNRLPAGLPRLRFGHAILVAHQAHTDRNGLPYYDAAAVDSVAKAIAGDSLHWAPISPLVRRNLRDTAPAIRQHDQNWHNLVFAEEWSIGRGKPLKAVPVVGRHGRADKDKWPASRQDVLAIYPADPAIDVRLLGAGDYLKRVMGEYPANWTAYRFGQMEPQQFLKSIDFFLYYHHPDLVEAFGRTVIEACASGAVAILPSHFEETFGEMALYRPAAEAIDTARRLHSDWRRYGKQSQLASRLVDEHYSPARHVAFTERLLGKPRPRAPAKPNSYRKTENTVRGPDMKTIANLQLADPAYDVTIIADMRSAGDAALRISHEIRIQHQNGFRTALLHLPSGRIKAGSVRGEINACVREGMADVITSADQISSKLVIVHAPETALEPLPERLPGIATGRVVIVASRAPDISYNVQRKHRLLALAFRVQPVWAPVSPQIRDALLKAWPEIPLEAEDWGVALAPKQWAERVLVWDRPVVGRIDSESPLEVAKTDKPEAKPQPLPHFPGSYFRILQQQPVTEDPPSALLDRLTIEEQAVGRFLGSLDFLHVEPDDSKPLAYCTIAEALQRGVLVLVKPELARELGPGAIACAGAAKAEEIVKTLARDPSERARLSRDAARSASARFAATIHAERIARLTGTQPIPRLPLGPRRQRIAFITSNGVGLGHLTRLLCIARRLPLTIDPIFVTMSQAFGIVKDFGFPVEYIPFTSHSEMSGVVDWNSWFRLQIEQIFDAYGITGAVFDGGAPYAGLVRAIASRPDFFSVWVRRGMWKTSRANDNLLKRQKHFDLVLEPRDVAGARDIGPTSIHAGRSAHVDPIRLLDEEELLDRRAAAKAVGIDPRRPAVLVQLGSGTTSEIVSQTSEIVRACAKYPKLQVVIAEWAIGAVSFDVWPDVKVLRGFPLSRYFNAFDFTISAVGYNSFNEIMSFGLPAIFLANENPIMDDQAGRAAYAVEQGAAFMTSPDELKNIHVLIEALLNERARSIIKVNCARIAQPNGAQAAADLIARIAGAPAQVVDATPARPSSTSRKVAGRKPANSAKRILERV